MPLKKIPKEYLKKKYNLIFNLNFDLPCRDSSNRRCSQGSPGGLKLNFFLTKLYINTKGRFAKKWVRYLTFQPFEEEKI